MVGGKQAQIYIHQFGLKHLPSSKLPMVAIKVYIVQTMYITILFSLCPYFCGSEIVNTRMTSSMLPPKGKTF